MFIDKVMYYKDSYHVQVNVYIWYFLIKILTFPLNNTSSKIDFKKAQAMLPDNFHVMTHRKWFTFYRRELGKPRRLLPGPAQPPRSWGDHHTPVTHFPQHTSWEAALFYNLQQWFSWLLICGALKTISVPASPPSILRISTGRSQASCVVPTCCQGREPQFPMLCTCWHTLEYPGDGIKMQILIHSFILGGDLRCHSSNETPGDVNSASPCETGLLSSVSSSSPPGSGSGISPLSHTQSSPLWCKTWDPSIRNKPRPGEKIDGLGPPPPPWVARETGQLGGRLDSLGTPPTPKKTKSHNSDSSGQTLFWLPVLFS